MPRRNFPLPALMALLLYVFVACNQQVAEETTQLPRSQPETEGVSSSNILKFLEAVDTSRHELHSFMFLRHGKVVAEGWWEPYGPELVHTMYSTSKSFTSTAIGFAVADSLLTVEDKVISFFPEFLPDSVSDYLAALTVKDLLTMSVGQDPDPTLKIPADSLWVKGFFETPVLNEPGSVFLYNSMATYMLSAIVTRVTGEKVIDYLQPRLFEPLGISGIDWETDPAGYNTGGWGLRLKTEDMAKFGQFLLQKGKWDGKQVLPGEWVEEATTFKIQQRPDLPAEDRAKSDWLQGYCYQFWRCRYNAFRADGAFGQYIIVMPDQDAVIAITSETPDMQGVLDLVWSLLLPAMSDSAMPADPLALAELNEKLSGLQIAAPAPASTGTFAADLTGKTYRLDSNIRNATSLTFQITEGQAKVVFGSANTSDTLAMGNGKWVFSQTSRKGPYLVARAKNSLEGLPPFKVAAAYTWQSDSTLELTLRYIESPHTERILCTFAGDDVAVDFKWSFAPSRPIGQTVGHLVK